MSKLAAGTYLAKPVECSVGKSKDKGTPFIAIKFEIKDGEKNHYLTWNGYITDKTKKRTIEAIVTCGFRGTDLTQIAAGHGLDFAKQVQVVVEEELYEKDGKMYPKIKWINDLKSFKKLETKPEDMDMLAGLNLGADLLEAQKDLKADDLPF